MREKTACMMRIKNEERFLPQSLERTFCVAKTIVLFDDGSSDATESVALQSLGLEADITHQKWGGWIGTSVDGEKVLHFLHSPFTGEVRPYARVQEARDKNIVWWHCQTHVPFTIMLCMDGDEFLTLECIRKWDRVLDAFKNGVDLVALNFLYFWNSEDGQPATRIRTDAIYGATSEGLRRLHFPRVFSVQRVDQKHFVDMGFLWFGSTATAGGQFHCGSIPRHNFRVRGDNEPKSVAMPLNVGHLGYMDPTDRIRKYNFYTTIDPHNKAEGFYFHLIEQSNVHAPGPATFENYVDE